MRRFTEKQLFKGNHYYWFVLTKEHSTSGLHDHDFYEFSIVLSGRYEQLINGTRFVLNQGDYIFVPLGSSHESSYPHGMATVLNIGASKHYFETLYPALARHQPIAEQVYHIDEDYFSWIQRILSRSISDEKRFSEFMENTIFYLSNHLGYPSTEIDLELPHWLQSTLQQMHEKNNFNENALETMVNISGKSQEYLNRMMRRYFDKTPLQFISEVRINYAKQLLAVSNLNVTNIAFECGYNDVNVFIKNFKKICEVTPNQYRKKIQHLQSAGDS